MAMSSRAGMGAVPYTDGVTFRVWAPFVSAVSVAGSFNGWDAQDAPLAQEGNGYWSVDVAGAQVNDQYKFVITNPNLAEPLWKNDPYARSMTNSVGNSVIADPDYLWQSVGYSTPPWNELVIYELHVGSFLFDPAGRSRRGDFDTVVSKLDYLQDLGVNAIEVMAADEFPGDISWGYNPAFIFAIEESYGGPNGLRRLVDAAHQHGLKVIIDIVANHTAWDSVMFTNPLYYKRDGDGLPRGWIRRMKRTIRTLGWRFNADRMVMDYTLKCYVPAAGGTSTDIRANW